MAGEVTTQGDRAIRSQVARRLFGLDGQGIKIGIISDSFNAFGGASDNMKTGDLPGVNNPNGFSSPVRVLRDLRFGSDEGRALAQIIFDIAPAAELLFHTTGDSEQGFAQAVNALTRAGADIIVDDILLATSTSFQDGVAAQAVNAAIDQGVVYVTAAGNNGDRSYESPFRAGTPFTFRGSTYEAHDFDAGAGIDLFQEIRIPAGDAVDLILNWDQPSGAVNTDLELFILDQPQLPGAGGNILDEGTILRGKADDPSRRVGYQPNRSEETVHLLIARRTDSQEPAPGLMKWISFANDGDSNTVYQYVNDTPEAGSSTIYGHQNAEGAITVGAVPVQSASAIGFAALTLENFSSTGGSRILFDAKGDRLPSPELRQKPDIVAPDRVSTTVDGFWSFAGTSASAPHVAAVAALMLQRAGGRRRLTPAQVRDAMQRDTIPIASVLNNFPNGVGLLQADAAVLRSALAEVIGTETDDRIQGSDGAENIAGLAGNDTLRGAGGFDALFGDTGDDLLLGDRGNDYGLGQDGHDRLMGGLGHDRLIGGLGRDVLNGGAGNDELHGQADRDILAGGKGKNQLIGGQDRDIFVLDRRGLAEIRDFRFRVDRVGLPQGLTVGQLSFEQVGRTTVIRLSDRPLATLNGVTVDRLSAADFASV